MSSRLKAVPDSYDNDYDWLLDHGTEKKTNTCKTCDGSEEVKESIRRWHAGWVARKKMITISALHRKLKERFAYSLCDTALRRHLYECLQYTGGRQF